MRVRSIYATLILLAGTTGWGIWDVHAGMAQLRPGIRPLGIIIGQPAPTISVVTAGGIDSSSATISWTTDLPATSQVVYGVTPIYGNLTTLDPALVASHSQTLSGLKPYTAYHFAVISVSGSNVRSISADFTFRTLPPNLPLTIGMLAAPDLRGTSTAIVWSTSTPADSQVDYGDSAAYGYSSDLKPGLSTFHGIRLSGLTPSTQYHFRVRSHDYWGNVTTSSDGTFTTGPATADTVYDLFYPRISINGGTYTGIALTDLGAGAATLQFSAFDPMGMPVNPGAFSSAAPQVLNSGTQVPVVDAQIFGSGTPDPSLPGWGRIRSLGSQPTGFYLSFNGSLTQMDGAGISRALPQSFVLPETLGPDYTRILLSNPDLDPATVSISLIRPDGSVRSGLQLSIDGYGTLAQDLYGDLFQGVTQDIRDYVQVTSDKGLLAYEYFGKNAADFATLTAQDMGGGAGVLYAPQYAVGGSWQTSLSLVNLSANSGTATLRLIADDGSQIGSDQIVPLAPGGKFLVSGSNFFANDAVPGPTANPLQGYVSIEAPGIRLAGSAVFGDAINGRFSAALPLVSTLQRSLVFSQVASSDTYFTGLAILNPGSQNATARIDLYSSDGTLLASAPQSVAAGRRVSKLLTSYFPALAGQTRLSGYIKVTVDQDVACFAVLGTNDLSVLSAIPAQAIQ